MIGLSKDDQDRQVLTLPGTLDNGVAPDLKAAFSQAVATGGTVVVDASAVERLSTACIQVLIAGSRAVTAAGGAFVLARPAEPLVGTFDDMGLFPVMMSWRIEA